MAGAEVLAQTTYTKADNTISLDQTSSWSPAAAPTSADTINWNGTYANGTVGVGAGLSVAKLSVGSPSVPIMLTSGTGNLTVGTGGIDLSAATQSLTIAAPVVIGAAQTWAVATGGSMLVTGSVTDSGAFPLTINSTGNLGTVILSPSVGNSVTFSGTNNSSFLLLVRTGGQLVLGGDGSSSPSTSSVNSLVNSSTNNTYGALTLTGGGSVQVNSGTWSLGDLGKNQSADYFSGTLEIKGGTLTLAGARYLGAGTVKVSGGTFKVSGTGSIYSNAGRFSLGAVGTSGNATMIISGGTVDLAQANGGNSFGTAIGTKVTHTAGTLKNGVTIGGGTNGGTVTTLTIGPAATTSNVSTAYTLSGTGVLISAGAIQGQAITTGTGDIRNFNFNGGTLVAGAFVTTNLGYASATGSAGGAAHTDPVANSVGLGTLYNNGGTLAPGGVGTAGLTAITGNYVVNSVGAVLAVDIGGTTKATAFQTGQYDTVTVSGTTTLAGNLSVAILPGFTPSAGDTYTILTSTGTLSGAFANVAFNGTLANTDGVTGFVVTKSGNTVVLSQYHVLARPVITVQPQPVSAAFGATVTFGVTATSTLTPVTYQWRKDGVPLSGQTAATLTLVAITVASQGSYDVVVGNSDGSVTSTPAALTYLAQLPVITAQPASVSASYGAAVDFTVAASVGLGSATYQWRKNGNPIGGATSSTYSLTAVTSANAGSYDVVVSNVDGSVTSDAATFAYLAQPPAITAQPVSVAIPFGGQASFVVTAAAGTPPITYQWLKTSQQNAAVGNSATLSFPSVADADAGTYQVVLTNVDGSVTSNSVSLTCGVQSPYVKANNTTVLSSAASWTPAVVPTALDPVQWSGTYSNGAVGIGTGLSVDRVQLTSPSTAITINTGTGNLSIAGALGTGIDLSTSTQNLTVNAPVVLGATQAWTVNSGRTLTVNGAIGEGGTPSGITLGGTGSTILAGNNTYTGLTTVNTGATLTNRGLISGDVTVAAPASGVNSVTFTNNGTVAGALTIAPPASGNMTIFGNAAVAGAIALNGGSSTSLGNVLVNDGYLNINGSLPVNLGTITSTKTLNAGQGAILYNNTFAGGDPLVFADGASFFRFAPGSGSVATLVTSGTVSFFSYGQTDNVPFNITFGGGTWNIAQMGQNNSGAQTGGTTTILGESTVNLGANVVGTWPQGAAQGGGFLHGVFNIGGDTPGVFNITGSVNEANGRGTTPPAGAVNGLQFNVNAGGVLNVSGGSITLATTAVQSQPTTNAITVSTSGTASFSGGIFYIGNQNVAQTSLETNSVTVSGGALAETTHSMQLGPSGTAAANQANVLAVSSGSASIGTGSSLQNLTIGSSSNATAITNTVNLSGGKLVVAGTLSAGAGTGQTNAFNWTGGQLSAGAIVSGANFSAANSALTPAGLVQSAGTLAPGDLNVAGRTAVTGNYTLGAGATLAVDIGGTIQGSAFQAGQYDCVTVSGATALAGTLAVTLSPGYSPAGTDTFTILNSTGALTGGFSNIAFGQRLFTTDGQGSFLVSQIGNTVVLGQYISVYPTITGRFGPSSISSGTTPAPVIGVTVNSSDSITYQWYLNGSPIAGQTASTLTITNASVLQGDAYAVVVSNSGGASTTATFKFSGASATSNQSVLAPVGTSVTFYDATTTPVSTEWKLDGAVVSTAGTFFYTPDNPAVGTHFLSLRQTLANGSTVTRLWSVRVSIPIPTSPIAYYVSPTGSDNNNGSIAAPFLTLEKARNTLRTLSKPLPAGGATVYLRGGTHYRKGTFTLTTQDSGTAAAPIIYTSYPGETAVISTGTPLAAASFAPLAASEQARTAPGVTISRIWEADASTFTNKGPYPVKYSNWPVRNSLDASAASLPDVFYNDTRVWLSRYPNHTLADDYLTPNIKMNGIALDSTGLAYLNANGNYTNSGNTTVAVGGAFGYAPADAAHVERWKTALTRGGLWLQGYWRVTWQSDLVQILDIDTGNKVIELAPNASPSGGIGNKYSSTAGKTGRPGSLKEPYWVVNLLEEMDQPGEWAIDFSRNKLYFLMDKDGPPPDGSVVVADFPGSVVELNGSSNVILQSLTFAKSLGVAVRIVNGSRNLLAGCSFANLTNMAVSIEGGTANGVVSGNFNELGSMGVQITSGPAGKNPATGEPAGNPDLNHFIVNNRMTGLSRYAQVYQPGVNVVSPSAAIRVAHNFIYDTAQMGVQFDGYRNIYEYNEVSKYGTLVDDTGSFYSYEDYYGNDTFRFNYSHDTPLANAITYDGTNRHVTGHYYGNVSHLSSICEGESIGIGLTSQLDVVGNVSIGGGRYQSFDITTNVRQNYNNNFAYAGYFPPDFNFVSITPLDVNGTKTVTTNSVLANGPNLSFSADPGFINAASGDVRLRPDSRIYSDLPGFSLIPFDLIGLYNDEYRSDAKVSAPFITTDAVTAVGATSATFNGTLGYPLFDANTTVLLFWGTADGGTNSASWQNVVNLGQPAPGKLSRTVTSITPGSVRYYYRFYATNSAGSMWSEQTSSTLAPVISVPANITVATHSTAGASVVYSATAFDPVGGAPLVVTLSPVSGSVFPLGTTVVTATARDAANTLYTATFNVTVAASTPSPWVFRQVGSVTNGLGGSVNYDSVPGKFFLADSDGDISSGTTEAFTYLYQPWTGDGILTARVASFSSTDSLAKAGLMFRESLTAGARHSLMYLTRSGSAIFQQKTTVNGTVSVSTASPGKAAPYWLKLVRVGNSFSGYVSPDGVTWTQIGSTGTNTFSGGAVYAGIALACRTAGSASTATVDNVTFLALPSAPTGVASTAGAGNVNLSWNAVPGAATYTVKRAATSGGTYTTVGSGLTSPAFAESGLTVGSTVYYKISATNAVGTGPDSAPLGVVVATPLQSWRLANFGTVTANGNAADNADPDGDGVPNLLEYALGTTPTDASSFTVPAVQVSGLRLQISFIRARSDVTYLVEASSDLATWTIVATNPGTVGQSVTVPDTVTLTLGTPRRFLHLRVTAP